MRKILMALTAFFLLSGNIHSENVVRLKLRSFEHPDWGVEKQLSFYSRYQIDSLIIEGRVKAEDFVALSDCCQKGVLKGINMTDSKIDNKEIPALAFLPVKANDVSGYVSHLQYISLPKNTRSVGERAFSGTELKTFQIYRDLEVIGNGAFAHCDSLKDIFVRQPLPSTSVGQGLGQLKEHTKVYIPVGSKEKYQRSEGWKDIKGLQESEKAFYIKHIQMDGQATLKDLLGDEHKKIDSMVVAGPLTFDDGHTLGFNSLNGIMEGVNLEDAQFEDDCLRNFFVESDRLKYVTLPKNLKVIGGGAFAKTGLRQIKIPSTVNKIEIYAFEYCKDLKGEVRIPEGVTFIECLAFYGANKIESLYLPSTLDSLQEYSLSLSAPYYDLYAVGSKIYMNRMVPPVLKYKNEDDTAGPLAYASAEKSLVGWKLYVPVGAKKNFENAEFWKDIPEIIETPELTGGVTAVKAVRTVGDTGLTEVYTLGGRLVSKGRDFPRGLAKGLYVVKTGGKTQKMLINE